MSQIAQVLMNVSNGADIADRHLKQHIGSEHVSPPRMGQRAIAWLTRVAFSGRQHCMWQRRSNIQIRAYAYVDIAILRASGIRF